MKKKEKKTEIVPESMVETGAEEIRKNVSSQKKVKVFRAVLYVLFALLMLYLALPVSGEFSAKIMDADTSWDDEAEIAYAIVTVRAENHSNKILYDATVYVSVETKYTEAELGTENKSVGLMLPGSKKTVTVTVPFSIDTEEDLLLSVSTNGSYLAAFGHGHGA